ncbi:hypothetical protein AVEN_136898-1 [Araneus ventricosus]|uniref:Uncharacterized protein n=1 Tax=Araneus ventricosus TaxID=182803 RepID=A0A4Y2BH52_ARAVE|nr:hypothetical protein AVEN_136898-1 [Araneus ventricosus]
MQSSHFWVYLTSNTFFSEETIVKGLIRDKALGTGFRFILSSEYFFEDDVRLLWKQLPRIKKLKFLNANLSRKLTKRGVFLRLEEIFRKDPSWERSDPSPEFMRALWN